MIKNIVFDMGMVLIDFAPIKVCQRFTDNAQDAAAVASALFDCHEWYLVDMGTITEDALLAAAQSRLETQAQKEAAAQCLRHWHDYALTPKTGMAQVVKMVKAQGCGVYLLSNTSTRFHTFKHMIPGIVLFDGTVISVEEKCGKPDRDFYQRLFDKYSLKPEECFFIDDIDANIDGANRCGMAGYCFADGNIERLKQVLTQVLGG